MTYAELLKRISIKLQRAGVPNFEQEAWWILQFAAGQKNGKLAAELSLPAPNIISSRVEEVIAQRLTGRPLAYITGQTEFYGLKVKVNPSVLIPRPETETLVEKVLEQLISEKGADYPFMILDVGSGSGCIALALLSQLPQATAIATDISKEALKVAWENAKELGLGERIGFFQGNLFAPMVRKEKFDLIISNPPYIYPLEIASLGRSVRDFEPRIAIESPQGGTWFHQQISQQGGALLRSGGILAFEIGNRQAGTVSRLIRQTGIYEKPQVFADLFGFERVVIARMV